MAQFILNFHGIGPVTRAIDDGERECWLDLDSFDAVLELVQRTPGVRLTFDDGNSSDCDIVLPSLLRRGLQAAFFVCSGRLDQPTFLSREQVRELSAHGMRIGNHGASHRSWRHLTPDQFRGEVIDSRRVLEEAGGGAVDAAACPFGSYDRRVLGGLRRAGYRQVCTSDGGSSRADGWLQPRTTVTRSMTLAAVRRLVHEGPGTWKQSMIDVRGLGKRLR